MTHITFLTWGTPLSPLLWLHWCWPPALAVLLWGLRKPRSNGIPFVVLGALVGYGVQWIVSYFVVQLPASVPKNLPHGQQLLRIMIINGYRTALISAVCALPLVFWLHSLTAKRAVGSGNS
jgi:hypothetical protein